MDLTEAAAWLNQAQIVESSLLAAAPAEVWESIVSMPDVNAELMPVVPMTYPLGYEGLDRVPLVPGRRLFRSMLLLFGVLPVDVHAIALASLNPGRGFLESSSSLLHRRWIHERVLKPDSGGPSLSDRLYFECRVPGLGMSLTPVVRAVFRHPRAALGWLLSRTGVRPPTTAAKGGNPHPARLFCTRRARVCARAVTLLRESLDPCVAAASTNMVSGKI
jgi:hypothetical protein